MGSKNNNFDIIYNRLLGLGIRSQSQLADLLGISSASVWKAKKENRFPKKWISILCQAYTVTPEWLLGTDTKPSEASQSTDKDRIIALLDTNCKRLEKEVESLRKEIVSLKQSLDVPALEKKKPLFNQTRNQQRL